MSAAPRDARSAELFDRARHVLVGHGDPVHRDDAGGLVDAAVAHARGSTPRWLLSLATGSVRRRAQLQVLRPDLEFVELRGNIQTRLGKVPADGSIVMAVAALQILGLTDRVAERFDVDLFVPSPGQGCVAVECRADDPVTAARVATVDHRVTRAAVEIERAFLAEVGAGCTAPLGAHVANGELSVFMASGAHVDARRFAARRVLPSGDAAFDVARELAREAVRAVGQ